MCKNVQNVSIKFLYSLSLQNDLLAIVLNFAPKILTRQTLIRFFMSLLTLTSGKFCPQNKVWSHFFYPQKLWSRANFALKQTLIPFFLSLLTLISGKFCPQTNFDLVFFVRNKFDLRLTLPSNQIWSQANFALKPTLISFLCPQKFWPEANFALSRILPSVEYCPQLNFALSWILPSVEFCPQLNFALKNFISSNWLGFALFCMWTMRFGEFFK